MRATVGETAADVVARLPEQATGFAFHINLTRSACLPVDRGVLVERLAATGIRPINAELVDISKRTVQRLCAEAGLPSAVASRDGDPNELLVVKTDCNYQAIKERSLSPDQRAAIGYDDLPHELLGHRPYEYLVTCRKDVANRVWSAEYLVVERFVTNRSDRFYRVYVAGNAVVVSRVVDRSPFKKMPVGIPRESFYFAADLTPVEGAAPAEVARVAVHANRFAEAAHMDYGALDVVIDDEGGLFVIDANGTPHWGAGGHPKLLAYLADGLAHLSQPVEDSRRR